MIPNKTHVERSGSLLVLGQNWMVEERIHLSFSQNLKIKGQLRDTFATMWKKLV